MTSCEFFLCSTIFRTGGCVAVENTAEYQLLICENLIILMV